MQKEVDYLIVGLGIAGTCFAKKCIEAGKTFHIIADNKPSASHIAAGLFNPVVIKRFNPVWRYEYQMDLLKKTFGEFETLLGGKYIHSYPVYRIFSSEQEINTWKKKIESKESLKKYLNPEPIKNHYDLIESPFDFGEVKETGWIDLAGVLNDFMVKYESDITIAEFNYDLLQIDSVLTYENIKANKIVFAEGIKVKNNPFFNFVPVIPNKGETLVVEIDAEMPQVTLNSKNFLMPFGENKYYIGATYDREWDTELPTEANKKLLIKQLKHYYKGDFKILEHRTAFRPTTRDIRPIIGEHPQFPNLYILNGMGTRGTFNSPDMSTALFNYIEFGEPLIKEADVKRFYKLISTEYNGE